MAAGAQGILGSLRILVDADTAKAQRALQSLGGRAQVAGAVIGAGLGMAGVAALRMGDAYKNATDAIRIGTGATGDTLKGLEDQFRAVSTRVPDDIQVVGQALADVSTRTGQTGDDLGRLTESFLDMSRLLNMDVSSAISSVTRLYGDWSVATKDQIATNDLLLRASQATGMSVDALAEQMVQFGAPLRNIGIEFEGAVAMLSKWEKEGVNTVLALGGMKIALGEFAKEGVDAKQGLQDLMDSIVNATTEAEAMAIGVSKFGSRAGPDMVAAIREGRFEFDDFAEALANGEETVQGLSDDTRDFGDAIREMGNRVKIAVGPITDSFAGIAESMGNAIFLLPALGAALGKGVVKAWQRMAVSKVGVAAASVAGKVAGVAYSVAAFAVGKFMQAAAALWAMMGGGRIVALAAAAGTKAGAAYGGAIALAARGAVVMRGLWTAAGTIAGGIMGSSIVAAVLPIAAAALAALAAKMAIDLGANMKRQQQAVSSDALGAISQDAGEAISNLDKLATSMHDVQGWSRILGDTVGGEQQALGLQSLARAIRDDYEMTADEIQRAGDVLARAAHEAGARGNQAIEQEILDIASVVANRVPTILASYDVLSSARITPPQVAEPIRSEFILASKEVARGFGSVRDALANPPAMISKKDRLENMAGRMKKVMRNIKRATEVGDPLAQQYWEKARAAQQLQIERLKRKTTSSMGDIKRAYKAAGADVEQKWTDIRVKTVSESDTAATKAIAAVESIDAGFDALDGYASGENYMGEVAAGIDAGIPAISAAANRAAAAAAAPIEAQSPPKEGPLRRIDEWGRSLMDSWLGGIEDQERRVSKVGTRLASALAPQPVLGRMAMGAVGANGGGGVTIQVGTLIADDRGLDELERRMAKRSRLGSRTRWNTNEAS